MKRTLTFAAALAITGVLGTQAGQVDAPVAPTTADAVPVAAVSSRYVALGDSAAAGPVLLPQKLNNVPQCTRSKKNYPTLVAKKLGVSAFVDATCSSATTENLFAKQQNAPAQLDAVTKATTLVTLGPIGANDAGLVDTVVSCLFPGCAKRQGQSVHTKIEATRPNLRRALSAIKAKAPRARIVVVGYGRYLPPGACPGVQPIGKADGNYIQGLVDHMDRVLASEAKRAGVRFADLRATPGAIDHTACAKPGKRWLEGLIPLSLDGDIPFHPTALGMAAFSDQVIQTVRARR